MIKIIDALNAISEVSGGTKANPPPSGFSTLLKCEIEHGSGAKYDLKGYVAEIHLFENIERVGITGFLQMQDRVNFIRNGAIIGEELLWLKFETAGASDAGETNFAIDFSKHPLYVFGIEEVKLQTTSPGGTTQAVLEYKLHFCSTEMITNDRIRLSKAYQGTVDSVVKTILKDDLQTEKPVIVNPTLDIIRYIAPNWHPLSCIVELCSRAQCWTGQPVIGPQPATTENMFSGRQNDFAFFETSCRAEDTDGGFFLVPLQRKMSEQDFTITLQLSPTVTGTSKAQSGKYSGYARRMLSSAKWSFTDNGNKWLTVAAGSWAAKHIHHNAVTKSFATYKIDYLKQLEDLKYSEISQTPVYWPSRGSSWKKISEFPDARVSLSSGSAKSQSGINKSTKEVSYPFSITPPDSTLLRDMQLNHLLSYQRVLCTLPGISGLQIGKMCYTDFPPIGMGSGTPEDVGSPGAKDIYGEDRNNNIWLITKIAHHLNFTTSQDFAEANATNYITEVELANTFKDTKKILPEYSAL